LVVADATGGDDGEDGEDADDAGDAEDAAAVAADVDVVVGAGPPATAGRGEAAAKLAIHSPSARTAPVSSVMRGDLSFMPRCTTKCRRPVQPGRS
jgi:hypothetical protein